jgi:hypothetical protein
VAEKLHAYTRTYEGRRLSTRAKDLVDLALIAELSPLEATCETRSRTPSRAARRTRYPASFRRRRRTGKPRSVSWRKRSASQPSSPTLTPMPPPLLDPVLASEIRTGTWQPDARRWRDQAERQTPTRRS